MNYRIIRNISIFLILLVITSQSVLAVDKENKKKSTFDTLINQLVEQVDKQIADRDKQLDRLKKLYQDLNKIKAGTDAAIVPLHREGAISREAMLTADEMIRDPKNKARVGEIAAYLRRSITRDQELFNEGVQRAESNRFQRESQIAKIRSEQTVLKGIRRDLLQLRSYPTKKEKAAFYLTTAKNLIDGFNSAESQ